MIKVSKSLSRLPSMFHIYSLKFCVCVLGGILILFSIPAFAGSELLALLGVLRDNGTITTKQYERLRREAVGGTTSAEERLEHPSEKIATMDHSDSSPVNAAVLQLEGQNVTSNKAVITTTKVDSRLKIETKGGLYVESADGNFAFGLRGNIWLDAAVYNEDQSAFGNGSELRRARAALEGRLFRDWGYAAEYEFSDNKAEVKDAYIEYNGLKSVKIKLGQFKEPFSLEEQTSGKNITFMERALPVEAFSPGRNLGLGIMGGGKRWSASAGLFGEGVGDKTPDNGDSGWGIAARTTYALVDRKKQLVHLGGSVEYRRPNDENEVRYRTRPESHVADRRLVDTRTIDEVADTYTFGLESAVIFGSLLLQGEYLEAHVNRDTNLPNLQFDGWYLNSSWLLTGESRRYDGARGRFKHVKSKNPYGAWELALRYSDIDLSDKDILGGKEQDVTLGLNWYVNPNVRFMVNYIWVNADPDKNGENDEPGVFQIRTQLDF